MEIFDKYQEHVDHLNQRFAEILDAAGFEGALIHAGSPHTIFLDDQDYPFKANPLFKSWLPLSDKPDCYLYIRPGEKPHLFYYQPIGFWHAPPRPPEGMWMDCFDITMVHDFQEVRSSLRSIGHLVFLGENEARAREWGIANINPVSVIHSLHYFRAWKTEYEQACLLEANRIAVRGHQAAREAFYANASEFEIQAQFLQAIVHTEEELPYKSITALNEHGAIPHYQHYDRTSQKPRSLLIDAGAVCQGYASDITRTYSYREDLFAEMIDVLDEQQQTLVAEIKPDLSYIDLHLQMHHRIARILHNFQLVDLEPEAIVELAISNIFFPHGLGHYLGIQVHDVGGFLQNPQGETLSAPAKHPFLRLTRKIEVDQIFTIEPGLYFRPPLLECLKKMDEQKYVNWEKIESLIPYGGIRIEDNICVKELGPFNLTRTCFSEDV